MHTSYLEFTIHITHSEEYIADLLAASLAEIGFESFERAGYDLVAYIPKEDYAKDKFDLLLDTFEYAKSIDYSFREIQQENWNAAWEKFYFEPILINDECLIHSSFHEDLPTAKYNIIIDPKMSFGTGHHETTSLMIAEILNLDLDDKAVLDMGCGTSVLAILAAKKGAVNITAIDIDDWCVENSLENIQKNDTPNIVVLEGDVKQLTDKQFDVIFANINRNILLQDIKQYAASLKNSGILLISGFYVDDIPILEKEANLHHLKTIDFQSKNNWALLKLIKQ